MKQLFLAFLLIPTLLTGQKVINVEYPVKGGIVLSHTVTIDKIKSGYTLWLPKKDGRGLIVFFDENRDTINKTSIIKLAIKNKLATLFVTTDNPVEYLFEESKNERA